MADEAAQTHDVDLKVDDTGSEAAIQRTQEMIDLAEIDSLP